jgi:hypothetical protein
MIRPRLVKPAPPSTDAPAVPVNTGALIEHRALDVDFSFGPGELVSVTIAEGDAITESDDRFTVDYVNGEQCVLYKACLRWVSRRERVWHTAPPAFVPTEPVS